MVLDTLINNFKIVVKCQRNMMKTKTCVVLVELVKLIIPIRLFVHPEVL